VVAIFADYKKIYPRPDGHFAWHEDCLYTSPEPAPRFGKIRNRPNRRQEEWDEL